MIGKYALAQSVRGVLIAAVAGLAGGAALAGPVTTAPDVIKPLPNVQRSGNIFHAAVCSAAPAAGHARCHARVVTDGNGVALMRAAAPNVTPSGLSPASLQSAYKITPPAGGVPSAASPIIAIVDAYGYPNAEADLAVYRSTFGLPPCTTANGCFAKFNQRGQQSSYPALNVGWAQETALDLDMASAMCPTCRIILVEGNTASLADLATAVNTAASLGALVISNSYGGGESGSTTYEPAYNHPGVAITVSSGDSGFGVQFPASSPHVTAVGGTRLVADASARGWSETAWTGAGSGCSTVYAKPSWQTDPGCTRRTVADVSAIADPATGVAVYGPVTRKTAGWQVYGGTSVAAPIIGAIYAANGPPVTAGSVYANRSALFDVTSGSNGTCSGSYLCTAGVGYDGPTGLGTPNGLTAF